MECNSIFVDYANAAQVKWWDSVASKFVDVVSSLEVVRTATNEAIGKIIMIEGPCAAHVIRMNNEFLKDTTQMAFVAD